MTGVDCRPNSKHESLFGTLSFKGYFTSGYNKELFEGGHHLKRALFYKKKGTFLQEKGQKGPFKGSIFGPYAAA